MATVLTLHHGDCTREFVEHPIEVARKALLEAAVLEEQRGDATSALNWADIMRRVASSLPERRPMLPDHEKAERERWNEEYEEARNAWRRTRTEQREALLLRVLGDDRLVIREMAARMNAELGYTEEGARAVGEYEARPLVTRMFRAGQLDRVEERFKNKPRYRYFRKQTLDGPIAELERTYRSGEVA